MRLFEPKRKKVIKAGENCIVLICSFVVCSVAQFYYGGGNKDYAIRRIHYPTRNYFSSCVSLFTISKQKLDNVCVLSVL